MPVIQRRNNKRARVEEEDDESLRDDILEEYWRVRKQYERDVGTQGAKAFERSRKMMVQQQQAPSFTAAVPLHIPECPVASEKQLVATLRRADNGCNNVDIVVNTCPIIPVEHVESTPPMQYWTHTEANVIAEDEFTLSHIPFLGDSVDDTSFCADLMKTFPEGIHGTKEGCGEYINDYILYYMVKAVKERHRDVELRSIFRHVYHHFPNKASRHELFTMYPDLQQRFEPETISRQEFTNEQGELMANFSSSRLLNSYEVLLCHKCFSYDCLMHNATLADGYGGGIARRSRKQRCHRGGGRTSKENNREVRQPCSDRCYLNIMNCSSNGELGSPTSSSSTTSSSANKSPSYKQDRDSATRRLHIDIMDCSHSSSSPGSSSSLKLLNGYGMMNGGNGKYWTPHEESIFAVLRKTGEDDFCKITNMLNMCTEMGKKKTCQEVYEYASRAGPHSPRLELPQSPVKNAKYRKNRDSHRMFRAMKWANTNGKVENGGMFKPCKHKGECREAADCHCTRANNLCTKYCGCPDECENRFPGCRCAPGNCRTKQCQCYYASWECDPDVCKSCNCGKLEAATGEPICKNVSIQRGLQKLLLVAPSQVAGWGCFANEDIEKNDFISEYCGEVISQAESERRGKIYDRIKCSYLFGLNEEQVVDATRVGNVIRFANHSKNPNCRARVVVVNGDHKIGIFAQRSIKCGEELFFNYAYNKSQQVQFVPKELSSIVKHREKAVAAAAAAASSSSSQSSSIARETIAARESSI